MQRWTVAAATALCVLASQGVHAASIASVSPQGEVAQVRQVAVKFSESVIPLNDLRASDPISLSCQSATPAGSDR